MLTQDDLNAIKKLLKPIKEDLEVTKSKVSKTEARGGVMYLHIQNIKDQQDVLKDKMEEGFEKIQEKLEENTNGILEHIDNIGNDHEKRIKRVEIKLGLKPTPSV